MKGLPATGLGAKTRREKSRHDWQGEIRTPVELPEIKPAVADRHTADKDSDLLELGDSPRIDPLRDINVPVMIEAGVVRMYEPSGKPLVSLIAHAESIQRPFAPLGVVTQMDNHLVILVEQRDSAVEVGYQHELALNIDIGGKEESPQLGQIRAPAPGVPVRYQPREQHYRGCRQLLPDRVW